MLHALGKDLFFEFESVEASMRTLKKYHKFVSFYRVNFLQMMLLVGVLCVGGLFFPHTANAGGVALGATRVIYPFDSKQTALAITNSDDKNRFLIQSWMENENGQKTTDFVLTPPLFVSKPGSENTLRIIFSGKALPLDRESLYWLNSKSIPAVDTEDLKGKNVLQIAVLSRIKVFVRPSGLETPSIEAPKQLRFSRQGADLRIENPSPYYVTLVDFKYGTQRLDSTMIAPKSQMVVKLPATRSDVISYQTIDDYGASSPEITTKIN